MLCSKYLNNTIKLLDRSFSISQKNSVIHREVIAGITTYLSMIYSVVAVPDILFSAGFPKEYTFIMVCLITGFGSLLMGIWANLPIALGCAISLSVFTSYGLIIGQNVPIPIALGAIFLMGIAFTLITVLGLRKLLLSNIPHGITLGIGVGIGLFLLLIAVTNTQAAIIVTNTSGGLPMKLGDITSFPVLLSFAGLILIIALDRMKIPGSILIVIILISVIGNLFDPKLTQFTATNFLENNHSLFFELDILGALNAPMLPNIFALLLTALFDATGTIRALAGQANLIDKKGDIISGDKALLVDSSGSIAAGVIGISPVAVYIESIAGIASGGRTGLTSVITGLLFLLTVILSPLTHMIPGYATTPALMYVGLLMVMDITKLNFDDFIDTMSGLICAIFILFSVNIVTGIMLGFVSLVLGRIFSGEVRKLKLNSVIIAIILAAFYLTGLSI